MICINCQKEIANDSKFCEFCGRKVIKEYGEIVKEILKKEEVKKQRKDKLNKVVSIIKNAVLILSVFIMTTFFLTVSYKLREKSMFLAIPITILISFIYSKIAKKFNL